jgi:hypothetical protein
VNLRDADHVVAHSYTLEVYQRPTVEPYRISRSEVFGFILQVFSATFIGAVLLAWLWIVTGVGA